jgi:hypothetical protein
MKRGNLRVAKAHKTDQWGIEGRNNSARTWVLCFDDDREKRGLDKWLLFDLKYDACAYLEGFLDWLKERDTQNRISHSSKQALKAAYNNKSKEQIKRKRKRKKERQNKKRNRK